MIRRWLVAAALGAAMLGASDDAEARPGGGHAFRSSSSSSRSSSSHSSSSHSSSSHSSSSPSSRSSSTSSSSSSTHVSVPERTYALGTPGSRRDRGLRRAWTVGSTVDPSCVGELCTRTTSGLAGAWNGLGPTKPSVALQLAFGLPVVLLVFALPVFALRRWGRNQAAGWSTAPVPAATPRVGARAQLRAIAATDPDFSTIAFEEQVQVLYVEAHVARGRGQLDRLAPYLRPSARARLASLGHAPVGQVIVGALRIVAVQRSSTSDNVVVELDTSYLEGGDAGASAPVYATEQWAFMRAVGVRTKPPTAARTLRCPSCGAGLETIVGATCGHCRQIVDDGRFGWVVHDVRIVARQTDSPVTVGAHAPELGTTTPTVVDPGRDAGLAALAREPGFTLDAVLERTRRIFVEMNEAWSGVDWERARPLLGRPLFEMQRYWIEAYRALGLRNVTAGTAITRMDVAAASSDRWYDALTIRVFATGLDFTLRIADDTVVGGSRSRPRPYSEYWTLVRGRGGGGPGSSCPSCGAPVLVAASAKCEYCHSVIEAGHFDWVLARIEQDEVYAAS